MYLKPVLKDDNVGNQTENNRFSVLDTERVTTSKRIFKPPIYVSIIGENVFSSAFATDGHYNISEMKMQVKQINYYRKCSSELQKEKKAFILIQLTIAKGTQVVLKSIRRKRA